MTHDCHRKTAADQVHKFKKEAQQEDLTVSLDKKKQQEDLNRYDVRTKSVHSHLMPVWSKAYSNDHWVNNI